MINHLHILCTVRNPDLIQGSLFVFDTVRKGFPSAKISVWANHLDPMTSLLVREYCDKIDALYIPMKEYQPHDKWIEYLVQTEEQPFWISDTDVIYYNKIEHIFDDEDRHDVPLFAGRYEPTFHDEVTDCIHIERLHTACMYFNPRGIRNATKIWLLEHKCGPFYPNVDMIRQHYEPSKYGRTIFYDTTASLFHALEGTSFTDEQNNSFDHLHCGTYVDMLKHCESLHDLANFHTSAYANPQQLRDNLKQHQAEYYQSRAINILNV